MQLLEAGGTLSPGGPGGDPHSGEAGTGRASCRGGIIHSLSQSLGAYRARGAGWPSFQKPRACLLETVPWWWGDRTVAYTEPVSLRGGWKGKGSPWEGCEPSPVKGQLQGGRKPWAGARRMQRNSGGRGQQAPRPVVGVAVWWAWWCLASWGPGPRLFFPVLIKTRVRPAAEGPRAG